MCVASHSRSFIARWKAALRTILNGCAERAMSSPISFAVRMRSGWNCNRKRPTCLKSTAWLFQNTRRTVEVLRFASRIAVSSVQRLFQDFRNVTIMSWSSKPFALKSGRTTPRCGYRLRTGKRKRLRMASGHNPGTSVSSHACIFNFWSYTKRWRAKSVAPMEPKAWRLKMEEFPRLRESWGQAIFHPAWTPRRSTFPIPVISGCL